MPDLCLRNLMLFFKDKTAVFLSFLAEFIIIGLYFLFLRGNLLGGLLQVKNAGLLLDVWMTAGLLGVASVTIPMGAYAIMVEDKVRRIDRDFHTAPIRPLSLPGGYLACACLVSLFLSLFLLLLAEAYLFQRYGIRLCAGRMLPIFLLLLFTTLTNSAPILLLVSCLNSSNALASCCTILGALIGFLTGIYLPVGALPERFRWLVKCFPAAHSTALLRQSLLAPLLAQSFGTANSDAVLEFELYMGVRYAWDGVLLSRQASASLLLCTATACLLLVLIRFSTSGDR